LGCGVVPGETALKAVLGTARCFEPAMGKAEREAKLTAWRKAVAAVVRYAR
jgi:glycerol kinase